MVDRGKAISRLRKLLALARSGDTCEARSARRKADDFMERQGLRESDADGVSESDVVEVSLGSDGFGQSWKFRLAALVARSRRCEALGLSVRGRRKVRVVGLRDDVGEAVSLFVHLDAELREMARDEMRRVVGRIRRDLAREDLGVWRGRESRKAVVDVGEVRRRSEVYLRCWREGAVDGIVEAARRRKPSSSAGDAFTSSGEAAGALVRSCLPAASVRERVSRFGARPVSEGGGEYGGWEGDFDERAYESGFRTGSRLDLAVVGSSGNGGDDG